MRHYYFPNDSLAKLGFRSGCEIILDMLVGLRCRRLVGAVLEDDCCFSVSRVVVDCKFAVSCYDDAGRCGRCSGGCTLVVRLIVGWGAGDGGAGVGFFSTCGNGFFSSTGFFRAAVVAAAVGTGGLGAMAQGLVTTGRAFTTFLDPGAGLGENRAALALGSSPGGGICFMASIKTCHIVSIVKRRGR